MFCLGAGADVDHPDWRVCRAYLDLPKPTFIVGPIIIPNIEFIGNLKKVGFGRLRA